MASLKDILQLIWQLRTEVLLIYATSPDLDATAWTSKDLVKLTGVEIGNFIDLWSKIGAYVAEHEGATLEQFWEEYKNGLDGVV